MKKHVFAKAQTLQKYSKTLVFEGFANWMQDDGNQHKYLKYINSLAKLMTNPCKIDARTSNVKNMENDANMEPEWM